MTAITFDTLRYAERLEQAGISREQAKAFAEAQRESMGEAELATKADLREMEQRIQGELKLNRWMVGAAIAVSVATFSMLFKLVVSLP